MAITTASGTKVSIGTSADVDYTSDSSAIADFEADEFLEVGEVENLGEFGDAKNDVTASALGDGRVRHLAGAADAGVMPMTCFNDPSDSGQVALQEASETNFEYNVKVELPDAPSDLYSNTIIYLRGRITSQRFNVGTNDNVIRRNFQLSITEKPIVIPAALISP